MIALTVFVYAPVRDLGFVSFDDTQYILDNASVARGLTWTGTMWAFTASYGGNWIPLTWLSHMLDVQLYGLNPGPHHVTNLLLHVASVLLLFGVLSRMTGALGRSACVAAMFAVHPLHVESVAWLAERKDVLSGLFFMLTIWGYLAYARRPGLLRYALVLVPLGLGLMAKPMLVTLPCLLLLLDYWPLRRFAGTAHSRLVLEKLPMLSLAAMSSVVTFVVQQAGGAVKGFDAYPFEGRVANALLAYVGYVAQMIWPAGLAALYPYRASFPPLLVVGAGALVVAATVGAVRARRSYPYLLVGWLWYLGTLVPVIGLVQIGSQPMADRYTYIPLIGVFVAAAWGAADIASRSSYGARVLSLLTALSIAALAVAARDQVHVWKDGITLWRHAVAVTSDNYRAQANLANALTKQGNAEEAALHYAEALRLNPGFPEALIGQGVALMQQGRHAEAIQHFSEALRRQPDNEEAHNNLGVALLAEGRFEEAIPHFSEVLRTHPDLAETHANLGLALAKQRQFDEAVRHLEDAVRLRPEDAEAHLHLGLALANLGRLTQAVSHYSEALRIRPNDAGTHNALGAALIDQGEIDQAISQYGEAVHLDPGLADAHANLGTALASRGRTDQAIDEFRKSLELRPMEADSHYDLAVLLVRKGQVRDAVDQLQTALLIDPQHQAARYALDQLAKAGNVIR